MKEYKFNVYSTRLLRDMVIGEVGYVLIDPQNNNIKGTTILTRNIFAIRKDLFLFSHLEQVKKYLSITSSRLYIVGIKKVGDKFFGKDFILDFSLLRWGGFIGFNILNIKRENLIKNRNYVCFLNIRINNIEISTDSFLKKREEYYFGNTYNNNVGIDSDGVFLIENINSINNIKELKKALKVAIKLQKFEIAAKIQKKINEKKNEE